MANEHYFSADPSSAAKLTEVEFTVSQERLILFASSGTFSSAKLDPGTQVLLKLHQQFPRSGRVLDLGCGWGPIGISMAKLQPATEVTGIDVNERSIELANKNAAANGAANFRAIHADELDPAADFDAIWSNPPIRIGKQQLHELLNSALSRLKETGEAFLVVQKQLGADSLQRWLEQSYPERQVQRIATDKGYRVIRISPATPR